MINPLLELETWIKDAEAAGEIEPTAAALATVNPTGEPRVRFVLTKGIHDGQIAIVTNYLSTKAKEIENHPTAELCYYWKTLFRQVRVSGPITKAPASFSENYWKTRPRESQLGAWASVQSSVIESYEALEARLSEYARKFEGMDVPKPDYWGAYFLKPERVELWLGQKFRIHQRALYERAGDGWKQTLLAP